MNDMLKQLQKVLGRPSDNGVTDAELLHRYLTSRDQPAFELLVWRYHRMVLGVCRRILDDPVDVEDAFQATFLVLAKKAGSIQRRPSLSSWLYGVARRVALETAGRNTRRRQRQAPLEDVPTSVASDDIHREELRRLLDEELGRLPEKYRSPLVLCYLEGATYDEVAERLGWPKGTVSTRLTRAREMLRTRLTRRGLTLSAGDLAGWLSAEAATEASAALMNTTAQAAIGASTCAARVASLSDRVVRAMFLTRVKIVTALVLSLAVFGAVGASLAYQAVASRTSPVVSAKDLADDQKPQKDDQAIQGSWIIESIERDGVRKTGKDVEGMGWIIKGDRMHLKYGPNSPSGPLSEMSFTLDPSGKPKAIDLVMVPPEGRKGPTPKWLGIYKLEGDHLTIANSSASRPTEFTAPKGSKGAVYFLRRGEIPHQKKPEKSDNEALQGSWVMTSVEADGTHMNEQELAGKGWLIEGDQIIPTSGLGARSGSSSYIIDPAANPKTIDLTLGSSEEKDGAKRRPLLGIYKIDGDSLTVAMSSDNRPTSFDAKKGSKTAVYIFRRGK